MGRKGNGRDRKKRWEEINGNMSNGNEQGRIIGIEGRDGAMKGGMGREG